MASTESPSKPGHEVHRLTRLEQLRIEAGLTQQQLADRTDCLHATICRIEKGHQARPATLKRIGDYFGVPAADLFRDALPVRDTKDAA